MLKRLVLYYWDIYELRLHVFTHPLLHPFQTNTHPGLEHLFIQTVYSSSISSIPDKHSPRIRATLHPDCLFIHYLIHSKLRQTFIQDYITSSRLYNHPHPYPSPAQTNFHPGIEHFIQTFWSSTPLSISKLDKHRSRYKNSQIIFCVSPL